MSERNSDVALTLSEFLTCSTLYRSEAKVAVSGKQFLNNTLFVGYIIHYTVVLFINQSLFQNKVE